MDMRVRSIYSDFPFVLTFELVLRREIAVRGAKSKPKSLEWTGMNRLRIETQE